MSGFAIFLIAIYSIFNIIGIVMFVVSYSECEYYWGCPNYNFYHTTMNKFGSTTLSVVCFVFVPLYFILWFIYWICHV